jgi:signal transduction histidine kinase
MAVSLVGFGDHVELTVTDDGRGFDLEAVRKNGSGLGLVSMEERAHVVGGQLRIVTRLRQGTSIHVRVRAGTSVGVVVDETPVHTRMLPQHAAPVSTEV